MRQACPFAPRQLGRDGRLRLNSPHCRSEQKEHKFTAKSHAFYCFDTTRLRASMQILLAKAALSIKLMRIQARKPKA
jgi:hypothetical protein